MHVLFSLQGYLHRNMSLLLGLAYVSTYRYCLFAPWHYYKRHLKLVTAALQLEKYRQMPSSLHREYGYNCAVVAGPNPAAQHITQRLSMNHLLAPVTFQLPCQPTVPVCTASHSCSYFAPIRYGNIRCNAVDTEHNSKRCIAILCPPAKQELVGYTAT